MKLSGIYCITNKENNKKYIGQSNNILKRWNEHIKIGLDETDKRRSVIHQAISKYNITSFTFEILEICEPDELNESEMYYIYEFREQGYELYNLDDGGGIVNPVGDNSPFTILSDKDVYNIRERYKNKEFKQEVYKTYKDKITYSTFCGIWNGNDRKTIHMDVYTDEIKSFRKRSSAMTRNWFKNCSFTEEDVQYIRTLKEAGMSKQGAKKLFPNIKQNIFQDIWLGRTHKNITYCVDKLKECEELAQKENPIQNHWAKFTEEQIIDIRTQKKNGKKPKNVYKEKYSYVDYTTFYRAWVGKTYKYIIV